MPMPSANGNISIMDKEFGSSSKKSVDELKRQVSKLKAELESERTKHKQVHRDKTSELKRIQENYEKERHRTVESITKRLQSEHAVELRRMRESLGKEKDQELRLVLKFKEEELKALKQQIQDEKERSKRTEDDFKKQNTERTRGGSSNEVEQRLKHEIHDLKEQKRKLDESYKLKCAADYEKAELIRRLKSEHERQINSLIRESKREVAKEYHHLRSAEKALEEKNHELAFKDHLTRKLETEKQEIRQRKTSLDSSLSDSHFRSRLESGTLELDLSPETDEAIQSPSKGRHDKERELRKKNAELQNKVDQLEKKCSLLEKENSSKHTGSHKAANLVEDKVKKLKKRNSELVSIARQLEEKAKKLQEEKNATLKQANGKANPSAEVEHMKKMFAKQRAKDLAEQARSHMEKDNKIENLRKEVASLAAGTRPQVQNDKTDELQAIIKKTAKERLVLEKKLASIESSGGASPVPGTIDHEKRPFSNTLTENDGLQIKKQLEIKEREYENLKKSTEEMKAKCSKLEHEREKFAVKCTMLHQKNAELGKRMKELNKLEEEIKSLKDDIQRAEDERHVLQQECMKLREQLKELMHVKQDLEASEQQRKMLEKEHVSSVSKLKEREEEIRQLHKIQEESTKVHRLAVTSLENDVQALQQKCADSNERANNLKNELEKLKTSRASNHKSTQTETPSLSGNAAKLRDEPRDVRDKETGTSEKEGSDSSSKDILEVAASRLKQLEMSDSEEDSLSVRSDTNKKSKSNQSDEDDISQLSRRIRQATYSDDSTSPLDDNYESDASRDVSSMAEGDLADMEDNDITTSMVDGEETLETGNELDSRLDNNKNIQKGIALPNKIIPSNQDNNTSTDQSIDEKYLTQEQDTEDSDSEVDEDNLAVYIARYSYDPYQHSPNDCPDAELAFQAGDYLYVFGDVDEDGFFLGELMDGQRGLVPSNFVEKIADENEMPWINGAKHEQEDAMDGSDDEEEAERKLHRNLRLNVEHIPDSNLGDIEEEDDGEQSREVLLSSHDGFRSDDTDLEPTRIPSPKHVVLERQHTRSIVLNWKPADLPPDEVKGYGIYVDGDLKMLVKGGTNTKALIEDIDPTQTYRVSVRTITIHGDESLDQEAMLTIGKDASVAPSNLQVSDVSPTSAKIEWLPGNSSYGHEILINGTPHRNIRPGTYQYTLTNLEPKECYRVHVRAKNPNILLDEDSKDIESDPLAEAIQFTTQEGGTPDPPLNVHLVATPSRSGPNTLEVSWIPVTITEQGTSNGARVTGYKVDINGVTCAEVTSPTSECVTVASWMIERAAKKTKAETLRLTVRTQSLCGESVPSNILTLPLHTFNFQVNKLIGTQPRGTPVKPKRVSSGEERKDDNHNVTPLKTERNVDQKNELNNKEVKDEPAVINKPDPTVKPSKDLRAPPVPKKRTKGKPVVWKMEVEEEDDSSNKSDLGGNSSVDDDEHVEICTVEPTPQKQETRSVDTRNIVDNQNEDKLQQDASDKKEPTTNKNEPSKASEDICQDNNDVSKTEKRERKISELSDIDMDELNSSLNAATSYKLEEKNKTKQDGKEPFLTPMDLSDSDIVDSSDEPLSVIDEAGEEAVDSMQKRSRSSHSHSLSDGFRSDDDVMDLLDEETDNDTDHALTAVNVRRLSAEQRSRNDEEANEGEKGLLRYLTNSAEQIPSNENEYFTNSAEQIPSNENEHFTNSAEQTPSNENEYSNGDRNQTYSDVEADHYEPDTPYTTSTPALSRDDVNDDNQQFSQDYNNTSDDAANRTYTVEDGEETPEEAQEEELIRIFISLYDYNPAVQSPNPDAEDEELSFNEGDLIKIYGDKDPDGFYWGELDGRAGFVPHNMVSEVQVDEEDLFDRTTSSMTESQANQYPTDPEHPSTTDPEHLQNEEPYPQDNVPDSRYEDRYSPDNEHIPVDGQHSQYPTVIVHKPSDASLHEPTSYEYQDDKTYQDDSNPVPHEATNETYSMSEDDSKVAFEDPRTSVNYSLEPMKMVALFDYDPQMLSPNPDSDVELRFRSGDILYVYGDMDEDGFYTGEISGVRGLVPSNFLEEFKDTSLPSQEPSDVSVVSEESAPGPSKTPNGTQSSKDEPPKKKKGIFSKGRQILKKMTKSPSSKK